MNSFSENEDRTAVEAGRILLEAHASWLTPKLAALNETISNILNETQNENALSGGETRLFIAPRNSEIFLPFPSSEVAEDPVENALLSSLSEIRDFDSATEFPCTYQLPTKESDFPFHLLLVLPLGGWDHNQPFFGLIALFWPGSPTEKFPFPIPSEGSLNLPNTKHSTLLPLPPGFERSANDDLWVALPTKIKRTDECRELEDAVAVLSEAGEKILDRLVPILGDAAWKSMARRVMHELSRTVAMPQPMLEESRKALNSAMGTIRRTKAPNDSEIASKLLRHLKTIDENLLGLQEDQDYVLSKVRWFFFLVAEELRSEAPEQSPIKVILRQAVESLGCDMDSDCLLESPDDPLWSAQLRLPRLFPQHCFEALISNSFLRRDPDAPVRFSISTDKSHYVISWTNKAADGEIDQLSAELKKPATVRTFGLRMSEAISETFFRAPLNIKINQEDGSSEVHHQLLVPRDMLLLSKPAETNVSS